MSPDEGDVRDGGEAHDGEERDGEEHEHGARQETGTADRGEPPAGAGQPPSSSDAGGAADHEKYCTNCGSVIDAAAELCPECGVRQQGPGGTDEKDPAIAALASFVIVGAGQLYNGQIGRGIALHLSMWVAAVVAILFFWLLLPMLLPLVVWGFGVYDAYDQAEKINLGEVQV